jgi:hypothetical protein
MTTLLNTKADGYRGVWYMNQLTDDEYRFKYSGGLGTYCAKHSPFAVYRPEVNKTFFCYGGTPPQAHECTDWLAYEGGGDVKETTGFLLHCVGCFDHASGLVSQPTVILDKATRDAHDNPVISVDGEGYVWVFSTSHGRLRPSFIHRSCEPYAIERFERIEATRQEDGQPVPLDNFSYFQVRHVPGVGFLAGMTRYLPDWAGRTIGFIHSPDGVSWGAWRDLGRIDQGHYQVSEVCGERFGTAFNAHPAEGGLNCRTNLYYLESPDLGTTWLNAAGQRVEVPVTEWTNPALVHDVRAEGRLVYVRDMAFDPAGRPVVLIVTSKNFRPGPAGEPRFWQLACWTGSNWEIRTICPADCNYDMGSLYFEPDGTWKLIAPTEPGPQPGNPGGEVACWTSSDEGRTWKRQGMLTSDSEYNHTFVRRPVDAAEGFYAFWADGHARQPSPSRLYFCDSEGNVRQLPPAMGAPCPPRIL